VGGGDRFFQLAEERSELAAAGPLDEDRRREEVEHRLADPLAGLRPGRRTGAARHQRLELAAERQWASLGQDRERGGDSDRACLE